MKNIFYKSIFLISILSILVSCEEKEFVVLNPDANTTLNTTSDDLVLLEEAAGEEAVTFSWNEPDFGYNAAPTYKVLVYPAGGDYMSAQKFDAGNETSLTISVGEFNAKMLAMGLVGNAENEVEALLEVVLSNQKSLYSAPIAMNVTPFSSILDLTTEWGVVGSATPGSWGSTPTTPIKDIPFWTTGTENVLVAYCTLRDGEIKFRTNNAWTLNYGDNGADGTLEQDGANITVTAGTYKITMNISDFTYTIEQYSWGLVGSFNDWGGSPDHKLIYNSYGDDWKAVITLASASEVKFRFNENWDVNYGDTGADGSLEASGDNIMLDAGNYLVTFNLEDLTYSFESTDVWGLVGSATPNGWDGPDHKFLPDFGVNEGMYYLYGISLVDGEIKVRQNDAWGVNYGDNGTTSGDLIELNNDNAPNIPVSAGTYNIELDFSVNPPTLGVFPFQD